MTYHDDYFLSQNIKEPQAKNDGSNNEVKVDDKEKPKNDECKDQKAEDESSIPKKQKVSSSSSLLPPGIPRGVPTPVSIPVDENATVEEKDTVPTQYVGRVIGKGGEMIRDLQARSACKIDVDQNVPSGAPRIITYRGTRKTVDFAKQLVALLCSSGEKELPLGQATRQHLVVPTSVIGKIIGRGGDMIRELQSKSGAKIQVDHSGAGGVDDPNMRQVTLTGTDTSVHKAEEMIQFLISNPNMDAMTAIGMLLRDKPSQRVEVFKCAKQYMGRIIGQKGITIHDLQKRSGSDLQINQDFPPGHDCEITIKGGNIEQAKKMLQDIVTLGPHHPYAGGRPNNNNNNNNNYHNNYHNNHNNNRLPPQQQPQIQQPPSYPPYQQSQPQQWGQQPLPPPNMGYAMPPPQQHQQQQQSYPPQQQTNFSGYNNPPPYGYAQPQPPMNQPQTFMAPQYNQQPPAPAYAPPPAFTQQQQQQQQPAYPPQQQVQYYQQPPPQQPQPQQQQPNYVAESVIPQPPPVQQPPVQQQQQIWKTAQAPDGQTYYYNEKTGETSWDKPPGMP